MHLLRLRCSDRWGSPRRISAARSSPDWWCCTAPRDLICWCSSRIAWWSACHYLEFVKIAFNVYAEVPRSDYSLSSTVLRQTALSWSELMVPLQLLSRFIFRSLIRSVGMLSSWKVTSQKSSAPIVSELQCQHCRWCFWCCSFMAVNKGEVTPSVLTSVDLSWGHIFHRKGNFVCETNKHKRGWHSLVWLSSVDSSPRLTSSSSCAAPFGSPTAKTENAWGQSMWRLIRILLRIRNRILVVKVRGNSKFVERRIKNLLLSSEWKLNHYFK